MVLFIVRLLRVLLQKIHSACIMVSHDNNTLVKNSITFPLSSVMILFCIVLVIL